ncbi:MAG: T9SS type A sorting domain-containing protein [Bacteroidia bacterium]|nr:T9SS type A sorting domain-containing protein [Bacteroidia bacterium]
MKRSTLLIGTLLLSSCLFAQTVTQPATPGLKGNGQVFYLETFGWENPSDLKGWTAPAGFYMEDPTDNGYNWHWWGNDSLVDSKYTREPPMRSTTAENGNLCLFLSRYNEFLTDWIDVNNSVVFPKFDCSAHGTVVVSYETCFMCYEDNSTWKMFMEVSVDDWLHSAQYDVSFGVNHKGRPEKTTPGKPVIFQANISDVAAGQPNVQIKFIWKETGAYFWQIDDFKLSEAWDNDLQMKFAQMEWNDGDDVTKMTPLFMIPKSQLAGNSFTNFKAAAINFGEYDQEDVYFEVDITKNSQNIFHKEGAKKNIFTLVTDTTEITDLFTPTEFGHYKVVYNYKAKDADNTPENNTKEAYFNVMDSVFSHADGTAEEACNWGIETYNENNLPMLNHAVGVKYHIFNDCEVNSISAYISGGIADGLTDFRFALYYVQADSDPTLPFELLTTDYVVYDSTMIGKWVTMQLGKDGESEFLSAGDLVYAAVEYNNQHTEYLIQRYDSFKIGADYSFKVLDPVSVGKGDAAGWSTGGFISERNLMIRLNLNEHNNIVDGVDHSTAINELGQNFPNPYSRATSISYKLADQSPVRLIIRDITGRIIQHRSEGIQAAGVHTINLDAAGLDPGVYFYTLNAGNFKETKRMTVSK